jgi:hypothetical protein
VSEENKALARRLVDEAINGGRLGLVEDLFAPELPEPARQAFRSFRAAFPDWREEIVDLVAEGDKVVARFRCSGTFEGEFMVLPPTGGGRRSTRSSSCACGRVASWSTGAGGQRDAAAAAGRGLLAAPVRGRADRRRQHPRRPAAPRWVATRAALAAAGDGADLPSAALVARKPAVVGWEAAAAFPVPALTADQALTAVAPALDGQWVLVHGAGGVTGGLTVQLAVAQGATVVATAGPSSAARVRGWGARVVVDYHDRQWPARVRDAAPGGRGVGAAVNAAPGGAATALPAVMSDGRLATITGDPPPPERGVQVSDVYVRADGARLGALVEMLAQGRLSLHVAATHPLAGAAAALQDAVAGRAAGAIVLMLQRSAS